jgi:hypothetical protein
MKKTKLYIAEWPDGTITILSAESKKRLFWTLDEESDPYATKITEVTFEDRIVIRTHSEKDISWYVDGKTKVIQNGKKKAFGGIAEMLGFDESYEPSAEIYEELGLKAGAK